MIPINHLIVIFSQERCKSNGGHSDQTKWQACWRIIKKMTTFHQTFWLINHLDLMKEGIIYGSLTPVAKFNILTIPKKTNTIPFHIPHSTMSAKLLGNIVIFTNFRQAAHWWHPKTLSTFWKLTVRLKNRSQSYTRPGNNI